MNERILAVDALDGAGPTAGLTHAGPVLENVAPVDRAEGHGADFLAKLGGNVAPTIRRVVRLLARLTHGMLDLTIHDVAELFGDVVPTIVLIARPKDPTFVAFAISTRLRGAGNLHSLLAPLETFLLRLFLDLVEVPLRSLLLRKLRDDLAELRGGFLNFLGKSRIDGTLAHETGQKEIRRKTRHRVAPSDHTVDSEIGADVPETVRLATARGDVLKDEVEVLVLVDASAVRVDETGSGLLVRDGRHPTCAVGDLDLFRLGIVTRCGGVDLHAARRGGHDTLTNPTRKLREEGRDLEPTDRVEIEVILPPEVVQTLLLDLDDLFRRHAVAAIGENDIHTIVLKRALLDESEGKLVRHPLDGVIEVLKTIDFRVAAFLRIAHVLNLTGNPLEANHC